MSYQSFSPEPELNTNLLIESLEMVRVWLLKQWALEWHKEEQLTVSWVRNAEDMRTLKQETPKNKINFPFTTLVLTNIGINTEKAGLNKSIIPIVTGRSPNSDHVQLVNAVPVKCGVGVLLRTDTLEQVIRFASILIMAAPKINIQLKNEYGFVYDIGVSIEPELTIPQSDMGSPAKEYRFETTMVVDTYVLRERYQGVIRRILFEVVDASGKTIAEDIIPDMTVLKKEELTYLDVVDTTSLRYEED